MGRGPDARVLGAGEGTYKQDQEAGCQVCNGEKASLVVFCGELEFDREPEKVGDEELMDTTWMERGYWVFNAEQCDVYQMPEKLLVVAIDSNERVENFFTATNIWVRSGRVIPLDAHRRRSHTATLSADIRRCVAMHGQDAVAIARQTSKRLGLGARDIYRRITCRNVRTPEFCYPCATQKRL